MAPKRRCPTCGSRQWHKEPLSGLIACSEGHVLQNYRNETSEVDQPIEAHMTKKRMLKSTTKKEEQQSNANPQLYHGARGRYHYFLCQQLTLRMQVEAITKLWDLPPEFEIICRDIWGLHLSLLSDPPPPEPYLYTQEQGKDDKFSSQDYLAQRPTKASASPVLAGQASQPPFVGTDQEDIEGVEKSGSGEDSEMEELLRQNSEISSSSEEDPGDNAGIPSRGRIDVRERTRTTLAVEGPASTLAVLVVALWQLRIPFMYKDLAKIIASYQLPYLDPVRLLPSSVVAHLTKHRVQALSPRHIPSTLSVHKLAARLSRRLNASYGVFTPECNVAPLLWRLIRDMGGTPTLYSLVKQVAYILKLPHTLHATLAPSLKRVKTKDPEKHKYDNVPPEVALMATIIIVVKMTYGLDGRPRLPIDAGDPALALPRIDKWLALLKELNGFDASDKYALFSSENAAAVGDLDDHLLDEYLEFCQHALLGQHDDDIITKSHFPVDHCKTSDDPVETKSSRPELPAGSLVDESSGARILRPAENYTIWNSRDVFGTLADDYAAVLGRAAKWIRIGEAYLSGVVELYERRFVRWWETERRREKGENSGEEDKAKA